MIELGEGWHQIDIYVAVSRHHLQQRLQQYFLTVNQSKLSGEVPQTMNEQNAVDDVIVSFDSLRFCVDRSATM